MMPWWLPVIMIIVVAVAYAFGKVYAQWLDDEEENQRG